MTKRLASAAILAAILLAPAAACAGAGPSTHREAKDGEALAQRLCARCHAIGNDGSASPHEKAPTFRVIARKWPDITVLAEAFAEGIVVGHPDMPQFELSPEEISALLSYLNTLKS